VRRARRYAWPANASIDASCACDLEAGELGGEVTGIQSDRGEPAVLELGLDFDCIREVDVDAAAHERGEQLREARDEQAAIRFLDDDVREIYAAWTGREDAREALPHRQDGRAIEVVDQALGDDRGAAIRIEIERSEGVVVEGIELRGAMRG